MHVIFSLQFSCLFFNKIYQQLLNTFEIFHKRVSYQLDVTMTVVWNCKEQLYILYS